MQCVWVSTLAVILLGLVVTLGLPHRAGALISPAALGDVVVSATEQVAAILMTGHGLRYDTVQPPYNMLGIV